MYRNDAPRLEDDRHHAGTVLRAMRVIGIILFAAWVGSYMRSADSLLHGSILIFHEAGHVLFMPFGEFMMVLGGSLFQLIMPLVFVGYFLRRRDYFAVCFTLLYLTASMHNLSVYIADARAGELPLLSGDRSSHDWTFLLIEMKRLDQDIAIGRFVHNLAMLVFWPALLAGIWLGAQRADGLEERRAEGAVASQPKGPALPRAD